MEAKLNARGGDDWIVRPFGSNTIAVGPGDDSEACPLFFSQMLLLQLSTVFAVRALWQVDLLQ